MTGTRGTLVVGAAQAGVQLACSLRELGYQAPITLVGAEAHAPYQRPPLSKGVLMGTTNPGALELRGAGVFAERRITVLTGERITEIHSDSAGAGTAVSASGLRLAFDRLALTTGARARTLPVPGSDLDGVLRLRDLDDARRLGAAVDGARRVVIVGGGFIGLEVAASLRGADRAVDVVLADDRLLARAVGRPTSDFFLRAHERRGVRVHLATVPARLLGDGHGRVRAVELSNGRTLPADLVVVGIGAAPRTELAEQLGLEVADGIVVDEHGRASDGVTVAAGDCVNCPCPVAGPARRRRFESVSTAIEQAKVAAATIAGVPAPYRAVPWFWSDQFDLKLQVAGLSDDADETVVRGDPDGERFSVLYYGDGRLVAADCVNRPADFVAVRAALAAGRTAPPRLVADPERKLKDLLRDADVEWVAA